MSQKLVFVTGKGGVGKSIIAVGLAIHYSKKGKRVLLAEIGSESYFESFLGLKNLNQVPRNFKKNIDIALWSGESCLKEYVLHLIKSEALYRLFFENKVSRSLISVAPGLSELSIMGKITSALRKIGPEMDYDYVIVDAYSSGHFLSLLRGPRGMADAIPFGPMGEQSRSINKTLINPEFTEFYIVSLPEELPVKETEELSEVLSAEFSIKAKIVLNKVLQTELSESEIQSLLKQNSDRKNFARNILERLSLQNQFIKRLKEKDKELLKVSLFATSHPSEAVENVSQELFHVQ